MAGKSKASRRLGRSQPVEALFERSLLELPTAARAGALATGRADPMSLVALHSILREGREDGYDAAHARIPDDLVAAHRRVGIHEWQIWRSGRHLFHLVECDDFDLAMRALEHDPANERWQSLIGDYIDHFELPKGQMELPLVWRMSDQDK